MKKAAWQMPGGFVFGFEAARESSIRCRFRARQRGYAASFSFFLPLPIMRVM